MDRRRALHDLPRHDRLDRAVRRPVRHGLGHHEQLRRPSPPTKNTSLAVVAPGIAEALFATALGLVAAIPAVIAYNKLSRDVDRYAGRLDGFAGEFLAHPVAPARRAGAEPMADVLPQPAERGRRRRPRQHAADGRHQRHADGRRHAGAADHLHGHGAAADGRRAGRPAARRRRRPLSGQDEPLVGQRRSRRARSSSQETRRRRSTRWRRGCRRSPATSPTRGSSCAATRPSTTAG